MPWTIQLDSSKNNQRDAKQVQMKGRRSQQWSSKKKVFLKISQNSQENPCARVSFLAHVFPCEFCEMFKNTFFTEHLQTTASGKVCEVHEKNSLKTLNKTCNKQREW